MENIHWDIIGLSEVGRAEEKPVEYDKYIIHNKNEVACVKKCVKNIKKMK